MNGRVSTVDGMPPLWRTSCARCRAPSSRLRPRVSTALARALGLPSSVLVGAAASVSSDTAKRARSRLFASSSTSSTTPSTASGVDQVGLQEAPVDRVVAPRRVGEALVAGFRGDVAASGQHLEELAQRRPSVVAGDDARLDGHPLEQPTERRGHLPAGQADERVGAEHHRIGRIERIGDANGRHVGLGGLGGHGGSPVVTW